MGPPATMDVVRLRLHAASTLVIPSETPKTQVFILCQLQPIIKAFRWKFEQDHPPWYGEPQQAQGGLQLNWFFHPGSLLLLAGNSDLIWKFRSLWRMLFLLCPCPLSGLSFPAMPWEISIASTWVLTSSLNQSIKYSTDHLRLCSWSQRLYRPTWSSVSFLTSRLCNIPSPSSPLRPSAWSFTTVILTRSANFSNPCTSFFRSCAIFSSWSIHALNWRRWPPNLDCRISFVSLYSGSEIPSALISTIGLPNRDWRNPAIVRLTDSLDLSIRLSNPQNSSNFVLSPPYDGTFNGFRRWLAVSDGELSYEAIHLERWERG